MKLVGGALIAAAAIGAIAVAKIKGHTRTNLDGDETLAKQLEPGFAPFADKFLAGINPPKGQDSAYSPLSMQLAALMLGPGLGPNDLKSLAGSIQISPKLASQSSAPKALSDDLGLRQTVVANSVWVAPSFDLIPQYQSDLQNFDGAEASRLNAVGEAGANQINQWVDDHTKNRIQKLFDSLPHDTALVLVNAFTFDGDWQYPFEAGETQLAPWHGLNGPSTASMMHSEAHIQLAEGPNFTVGRMPYKGIDMAMDIILPKLGHDPWQTFNDSKSAILAGDFKWNDHSTSVAMPKFEQRTLQDITPVMKSLGIGSFLKDLPGQKMVKSTLPISVSQVMQATWVKVDEQGTKAAAATGMAARASAIILEPKEVPFNVDHPFLFVIRDLKTGAILFVGAEYNPSKG